MSSRLAPGGGVDAYSLAMKRVLRGTAWLAIALAGAIALAVVATTRGEPVSVIWLLVAGVATYTAAYRFYSKFLASRVLMLDDTRPTPAERLNDGRDFVPTHRWVIF